MPRRGRVDRDGPTLSPFEPPCRTYVAVPFNVAGPVAEPALVPGVQPPEPPTASGVLALYDRLGSDEFDDADLITLRTFAGQAAVAVDNVRVHQEAQRLSLTDPLTGLWNYRYLRESIRREVERASRFGRMLAVLALDLDRFKEVNDTYGHTAGDAVLVEFARRISGVVREVDLAFRQGGEEFVVLLPETDADGAAIVARRIGAAVRDDTVRRRRHRRHRRDRLHWNRGLPGSRGHRAGGAERRRRRALRGEGGRPRRLPHRAGRAGRDGRDPGRRRRRATRRRPPAGRGRTRKRWPASIRTDLTCWRRVTRDAATATDEGRIVSRHVGRASDPTTAIPV